MFRAVKSARCPSVLLQFDWKNVIKQKGIGDGTYGEVLKCKSTEHGDVAVKVLTPACNVYRKEFMKEALILNSLSHANIVTFFGIFKV